MRTTVLIFILLVLFSANGYAQETFHVFPQIADGVFPDGTYYRSTLMITPWFSSDAPVCSFRLYGMNTTLDSGTGSVFSITIPAGSFYAGRTAANQGFASGYATLTCDKYTFAQVLYSFYAANGGKLGEATVFSTQETYSQRLVVDYRDGARLGIAIANNTDLTRNYKLTLGTRTATVQVPARTTRARFLDELLTVAANEVGLVKIEYVEFSQFAAVGLRFTGAVFSTIPAN